MTSDLILGMFIGLPVGAAFGTFLLARMMLDISSRRSHGKPDETDVERTTEPETPSPPTEELPPPTYGIRTDDRRNEQDSA